MPEFPIWHERFLGMQKVFKANALLFIFSSAAFNLFVFLVCQEPSICSPSPHRSLVACRCVYFFQATLQIVHRSYVFPVLLLLVPCILWLWWQYNIQLCVKDVGTELFNLVSKVQGLLKFKAQDLLKVQVSRSAQGFKVCPRFKGLPRVPGLLKVPRSGLLKAHEWCVMSSRVSLVAAKSCGVQRTSEASSVGLGALVKVCCCYRRRFFSSRVRHLKKLKLCGKQVFGSRSVYFQCLAVDRNPLSIAGMNKRLKRSSSRHVSTWTRCFLSSLRSSSVFVCCVSMKSQDQDQGQG